MLHYEGLFFENKDADIIHELENKKLDFVNDILHCTFKYRPEKNEIFNELVGKYFDIFLTKYGNNGENSGFEIELPDELEKYYINFDNENQKQLVKPHITVSLKEGSNASDTRLLNFIPLKRPIKITGRFGYWIKEDDNEYLSYEPYNYKN